MNTARDDLMNALIRIQVECSRYADCHDCPLDTWCDKLSMEPENVFPSCWDLQSLREEWFGGDD